MLNIMKQLKMVLDWILDVLRIRNIKLAEGQFGTGARPQPLDERDYQEILGSGTFDWNTGYDVESSLTAIWGHPFKLVPENQDGSSSCVAQAFAMYSSVLNCLETGTWTKASAKDIYSYIFLRLGGAYLRDGAKRLIDFGVLPEAEWPSYDNGNPPDEDFMREKISETDVLEQLRHVMKGREYRSVTKSIDEFAKAISLNHGLVFGVNGEDNGTWTSTFPKPPTTVRWGHALYAGKAKLINGKKYIGVLNSWGNVGESGWQWIGEEWFSPSNVYDGWTISDEPNHIDRSADFDAIDAFIKTPEFENNRPQKGGYSFYHPENWAFIQSKLNLPDITQGMYYDYQQAKILRKKYGI